MKIDFAALKIEHARLTAWLKDNALEKCGTAEFRKASLTHRAVTDLLRARLA